MSKKNSLLFFLGFATIFLFSWFYTSFKNKEDDFSKQVKVSLRNVGHQLLMYNKDSTSLVLPVIAVDSNKYVLSFQSELAIEPNNLVTIIDENLKETINSNFYLIEVKNCNNQEVVYSFEIKNKKENSIISCAGRVLPKGCYMVELNFINNTAPSKNNNNIFYALILGNLLFLYFFKRMKKKKPKLNSVDQAENKEHQKIGSFKFYAEQNKLVQATKEISLSNKECELLAIFISRPNQIIKREFLSKKVWEDKGVIVGRSLDTYISKLRKILSEDDSIKLINIHGVGYKLEIKN